MDSEPLHSARGGGTSFQGFAASGVQDFLLQEMLQKVDQLIWKKFREMFISISASTFLSTSTPTHLTGMKVFSGPAFEASVGVRTGAWSPPQEISNI